MGSFCPHALSSTALLSVCAGLAAANPVPWVSIGVPVDSRGLYGEATNTVLVTPPVPAGAPFTYMTISGTLTSVAGGTYPAEACIEVTTPSGQSFVIKPFTTTGFSGVTPVPSGSVTIPISGNFGAGGATLRFFELYRDSSSGPDATWNNIVITLHNPLGGDTPPLDANITGSATNPDVSALGVVPVYKGIPDGGPIPFATTRVVDRAHIRGFGTGVGGWISSSSYSHLSYVNLNLTAQKADGSGPVTWTVNPFGTFNYAASSSEFDIVTAAPAPVLTGPGFDWSYTLTDNAVPSAANAQFAEVWFRVQPIGPDAPASTDLGTMRSRPALGPVVSTPVSATTFSRAANEVKWYTFNTEFPCSDASGFWLDIHTQIPAGSTISDHELGLYDTTGHRLADNDDGGSNARSQLSFGQTSPTRPPVDPSGGPYDRNGFSGNLPAGQHFLAVSVFNTNFADTGWYAASTNTQVGDINFEVRTNLPPLIPPFTDLGTLAGSHPAPTPVTLALSEVKWFRFDIPQPINNVTRYYLDIDTLQPGGGFMDTMLGLYNHDGVVVTVDDDDGGNTDRSQLSYGIGPANRAPIVPESQPGDGRDGNLDAGRYYIAASMFATSFNNEWSTTGSTFYTGDFPLNLRHNFPSGACSPADLGSAGGVVGPDGVLNNNDFIAFITLFFAHDPLADLGIAGGLNGSDGQFNNNDFIAFINRFFAGCP